MKKTTLALAALLALTSGSALATVKKDYQLNFFAQVDDGFSFERLDGKSWSEAIDIKHSALRGEFESTTVKTLVSLSASHVNAAKPLKAKLTQASPKLVNKADYTQTVSLDVSLGGKDLTSGNQAEVKDLARNLNHLDLVIAPKQKQVTTGDYEGKFAIEFEYGV